MNCCGARRGSGPSSVPAVGQAGTEGPEGACLASLISLEGPALLQPTSLPELLAWALGQQEEALCVCRVCFLWLFRCLTVARGWSAALAPVVWAWLRAGGKPLLGRQITHLEKEGGCTGMALFLNIHSFIHPSFCLESVRETKTN